MVTIVAVLVEIAAGYLLSFCFWFAAATLAAAADATADATTDAVIPAANFLLCPAGRTE